MKRKLLLLCLLSSYLFTLQAQSNLMIDQNYTVEEMVMDFFNHPDITISNVSYTGSNAAYGFFDSGDQDSTALEVGAGILICSGEAPLAVGPNTSGDTSGSNGTLGDEDLDNLINDQLTADAAVITFDLTASSELLLDFNYVFASEEYCEFVDFGFNDVFGFFVSGPGITGPFSNNSANIAILPNTLEYVGVNTVNDSNNSDLFIPNSTSCNGGQLDSENMEYDGFSIALNASFQAVAGETYQIKLAIADVSDGIYDSGVFLSFNSLSIDSELTPPSEFAVANITSGATVTFENNSKYATSYLWDFGNGTTSTEKNPGPINFVNAGTYEVSLTTQNYCCTDVYTQMITVSQAVLTVDATTTNNPLACFGDANAGVQFDISGGVEPYNIVASPLVTDLMSLSAGTYNITITDAVGTETNLMIEIEEPDVLEWDIDNIVTTEETDGQADGTASVEAQGGTLPYTYLWSTGATTNTIEGLSHGDYFVTVEDANGCQNTLHVTVATLVGVFHNNDFAFQLFPNPVTDNVTVKWSETGEVASVKVYDVLGNLIVMDTDLLVQNIQVDFPTKPAAGIYYLELKLTDGRRGIERFMVR